MCVCEFFHSAFHKNMIAWRVVRMRISFRARAAVFFWRVNVERSSRGERERGFCVCQREREEQQKPERLSVCSTVSVRSKANN